MTVYVVIYHHVKFEKEQKYVQGVMKKINKHFNIIGWVRHKWLQPTTIKINYFCISNYA
jgi:hypothetical protein